MVADTCRYILKENLGFEDAIYYSLVAAIYTIYARPFTESHGAGKLAMDIIPREHRLLHQQLLKHRNQVYAHSDAAGAPAAFGNINQVRFFIDRAGDILPGITRWRSEPAVVKEIIVLCEALKTKTRYWIKKLENRYFPHLKVPAGEYVIDLDPVSSKFLTRVDPLPRVD